jgi:hypothetical protein|tara:strand:- start:248 stop:412 length:165 start_codon:yes stop_codon:yes gene_type:complete
LAAVVKEGIMAAKKNADFTGRKRFLICLEVFYNPLEGKKNGTIQRLITRSLLYA